MVGEISPPLFFVNNKVSRVVPVMGVTNSHSKGYNELHHSCFD